MNVIITIVLFTISSICSIYLIKSKNLYIIASIEPEKIPEHLKNKVVKYFITSLMLTTIFICLAINVLEINSTIGIIFILISILICLSFYGYYMKIKNDSK
ncbi:hypothetical protein CD134_10725 [Staphylococcus lutrae]|uniref:DUF3784 domain-containing protein n=1 Tax=Staphylococcus lutrae TaxID=155085 RepID=A0AAC9RMQ9_9STAP|nr:hypothetical protein B5P37_01545 [Staphylococcus lutrae]PNZ34472.1 hypothetical protein CD134_10725 [Staphylococcus lutrae]